MLWMLLMRWHRWLVLMRIMRTLTLTLLRSRRWSCLTLRFKLIKSLLSWKCYNRILTV